LDSQELQSIHDSVLKQAAKSDLLPLTQHLTDYFQMDVSYIRSEFFITAIIHVPATASDSFFKVFRYIPFPIPISDNLVLNIHAREEIIAVGHNNQHRVLSQTQLQNCNRHYNKYICETPLITNTNFSTTCVGALMDHNPVGIQTHCSISSAPAQEAIFQISNNQFAIYSPETFTGRGRCVNGTHLSALISTISKVIVPPGCTFYLRNHVLTVPVNAFTIAEPWVQETKWDTMEVPRQLLMNDLQRHVNIHQLLAKDVAAESKMQASLELSSAMMQAANRSITEETIKIRQAVTTHYWYIVGLASAGIAVLILICVCMCRRYRNAATVLQPFFATIPMHDASEAKF
jgi:hypothetical protein